MQRFFRFFIFFASSFLVHGWLSARESRLYLEPACQGRRADYAGSLPLGALCRLGTTRLLVGSSAAFSPNGKWLATTSGNGVYLWERETGKDIRRLKVPAWSLAYSADGKVLACGGAAIGVVSLWDTATGKEIRKLAGHQKGIPSVAFSPNGKVLASASDDGTVRLWETGTGRVIRQLRFHAEVKLVIFSPDGTMFGTGCVDEPVRLWDTATGKEVRQFNEHESSTQSFAFSPDGKCLAVAGRKFVRLLEVATGKQIQKMLEPNGCHAVAFSPDGKVVALGNYGGSFSLWKTGEDKPYRHVFAHGRAEGVFVTFSPDGKVLASWGGEDTFHVRLWDVATGKELLPITGHHGRIKCIAFSPDGRILASGGGGDNTIVLWNTATGKLIRSLDGHERKVNSIAFSPDSKLLISGSWDKTIRIWNVGMGKELCHHETGEAFVDSLAFMPDGRRIVAVCADRMMHSWEVENWREVIRFGKDPVLTFALSSDGKLVATGGEVVPAVRLWDATTGRELRKFGEGQERMYYAAFSSDSKILATASADGQLYLWQIQTGKLLCRMGARGRLVTAIAFSPDGRTLASAESFDESITLWEVRTGKIRGQFCGYSAWAMAFSPDGKTLASAGADTTLIIWDLSRSLAPRPTGWRDHQP